MIFVLPNPTFQLAGHASIEYDPASIGHHVNIELFHVSQPVIPSAARDLTYTLRSYKLIWVINTVFVRSLAVCAARDDTRLVS